jgi:hypothetical protein
MTATKMIMVKTKARNMKRKRMNSTTVKQTAKIMEQSNKMKTMMRIKIKLK